jgi:hypothetical protein
MTNIIRPRLRRLSFTCGKQRRIFRVSLYGAPFLSPKGAILPLPRDGQKTPSYTVSSVAFAICPRT